MLAWTAPPWADNRKLVFSPFRTWDGARCLNVPCGRCPPCGIENGRMLGVRCVHEAQIVQEETGLGSVMCTLTFDDAHLPDDRSASKPFAQAWLQRVRDIIGPFRYLLVAEYGGRTGRVHYHCLLFGVDFADRVPFQMRTHGMAWRCPLLTRLWPYGATEFYDLNLKNASYCTRYAVKQVGGRADEDRIWQTFVAPDGEPFEAQVLKPFLLSSRRPGLGARWFEKYRSSCFPSDFVVVDGHRLPVPRFYLNKLPEAERLAVLERREARRIERLGAEYNPVQEAEQRVMDYQQRTARQANIRENRARLSSYANSTERALTLDTINRLQAARLVRPLE